MPGLVPNIDNYTVPGGIKLFFNDGSGERDLGNIVDLDIEPSSEILEHKTNRSGKRRTDKVLSLEDKLLLRFKLDEPVIENLKYFFRGGAIEPVGAGTGTRTDNKLTLFGTAFQSVGPYYGLSGVTVRQFLDYVFLYDGASYHDHSAEADTLDGTPFDLMTDTGDYLYLGKLTKFQQTYFDFAVVGAYSSVIWEYWNGTAWDTLSVNGAAANLGADGVITFTPPTDWAQNTINGATAYFIRVSAGAVTSAATVNEMRMNAMLNVDYTIDAGSAAASGRQDGRIARQSGGIFVDGEEVKVSFTHTTWTGIKMGLFTGNLVEGAARLEMTPAAGRGIAIHFTTTRAVLRPNGALPLDDTKWLEVPFEMQVLDDFENVPDYPMGAIQTDETS